MTLHFPSKLPAGSRALRQSRMAAATVAAGILPAVAGGIPAARHPEKRLTNCCI
jgi:hypothetical protein